MLHPRRPHSGVERPRHACAWRSLFALALWSLLTSTVLSGNGNLAAMDKPFDGKAAPSPDGSRFVQVREHRLLGYRVTEVVLGQARLDAELPLLVQFHGRGDRPHIPSGDHTSTEPIRLMLPWAPEKLGDGYTWFPLSITERRHAKVLGHHIRERADEFAKVLAVFQQRRPTEGQALVSGFSQGGMMSFALALRHPDLIDGAFPSAGWLPEYLVEESWSPKADYPPIRSIHGRGDPIVPAEPAVALVDGLRARGLDATIELFPWDEHSMSEEMYGRYEEHLRALIRSRREDREDGPVQPPDLG